RLREQGAGLRDRRPRLGGARQGRRAGGHPDRGARGDGQVAGRGVTADSLDSTGQNLLRDLAPQVLGAVGRRFGDFAAEEDAVQEALLAAAMQWPGEGVPQNPRGWLIQVAARRMTDHLRAELARRRREAVVVTETPRDEQFAPPPGESGAPDEDDTLILLFMCSHPRLTRPSATPLALPASAALTRPPTTHPS